MKNPSSILFLIIFCLLYFQPLSAQQILLGEIDFPNSGLESAQSDFIEGVLFLHNFEYEDAARAFRRAQEIDPNFVLAHWGEAMTHNHPIWMEQDRNVAQRILHKLGNPVGERQAKASTQREKEYLMTIDLLYGNTSESKGKSKIDRDFMYRDAMEDLHNTYPNDHEAAAFYGLSILGTAHEGRDYSIYMRAAGELLPVWTENQKHPGAAHYLIHSFDDPIHAPLGLPMAKVYSEIAPSAAHAQHMTSHIFLALGMWDGVVNANIVAREVQNNREIELNESLTVCGHYPWWLQYGYLQQGESGEVVQVLRNCLERMENNPSPGEIWHFAIMRAHQAIDTENWTAPETFTYNYTPTTPGARNYYSSLGYESIQSGNIESAQNYLQMLVETDDEAEKEIQVEQLEGLLLVAEGNNLEGLEKIRSAILAESKLPIDFGPPTIVKPSLELLGDVLMDMGEYDQAIEAYNKQLERTPKRRRSLIGKEQARSFTLN